MTFLSRGQFYGKDMKHSFFTVLFELLRKSRKTINHGKLYKGKMLFK